MGSHCSPNYVAALRVLKLDLAKCEEIKIKMSLNSIKFGIKLMDF